MKLYSDKTKNAPGFELNQRECRWFTSIYIIIFSDYIIIQNAGVYS